MSNETYVYSFRCKENLKTDLRMCDSKCVCFLRISYQEGYEETVGLLGKLWDEGDFDVRNKWTLWFKPRWVNYTKVTSNKNGMFSLIRAIFNPYQGGTVMPVCIEYWFLILWTWTARQLSSHRQVEGGNGGELSPLNATCGLFLRLPWQMTERSPKA